MKQPSILFIIPLTPKQHLNDVRRKLQAICFAALKKQGYKHWSAVLIGFTDNLTKDSRFINILFEGTKEEKLQIATTYIIQNKIQGDFIVRLDDDDIINPYVLETVKKFDFDLYVDKHQWFWHYESGKISRRVWNWFPNTCIHKREHALAEWGDYSKGDFKRFKRQALLIENDHSKLHPYYKDKNVVFAARKKPLYLRTITSSSITAHNSQNYEFYLKRFGLWHTNNLRDFQFLNGYNSNNVNYLPSYSIIETIKNLWMDYRENQNYLKNI